MRKELENYLIATSNFEEDYREWLLENEEENSDENFYEYVNDYFNDEFKKWQEEQTIALAEAQGLKVSLSTRGVNGYPKNLKNIILGFNTYEEVTDFISKIPTLPYAYDIEKTPSSFKIRDGHSFWENEGERNEEYSISDYLYKAGENYNEIDVDSELDNFKFAIKETVIDEDDLEFKSIREILDKAEELKDLNDSIDEDDEGIISTPSGYETIKNKFMSYSHDVYKYEIGVEL